MLANIQIFQCLEDIAYGTWPPFHKKLKVAGIREGAFIRINTYADVLKAHVLVLY